MRAFRYSFNVIDDDSITFGFIIFIFSCELLISCNGVSGTSKSLDSLVVGNIFGCFERLGCQVKTQTQQEQLKNGMIGHQQETNIL